MCDTLCAIGPRGTLFGKNSDRPPSEVQLIEPFVTRSGGGQLRTQYLALEDTGAFAVLGSRPDWLWGFEHGVNEHRVAIGNEKVYTVDDPFAERPGLIGMDLVRLGLERGRTADEALDWMVSMLERHGQGGVASRQGNEPYFSSFLIADPRRAWVLETSARTWVAEPVIRSVAISNRLTIRDGYTRSSANVPAGSDWDAWRSAEAATGHADGRLASSRACLARHPTSLTPRDFAAHLRDHGDGPWGRPGGDPYAASPLPEKALPDGTGVTVCMHVRRYQNTTSSMIAELPADPDAPLRAWVAPGSPCASIYVPVFPALGVPAALGEPETWQRFAALRDRVERDGDALFDVRAAFGPLEAQLWAEADEVGAKPERHRAFVEEAWAQVEEALREVEELAALRR
jgi:secernin